jgi:tRNA A-37 threonylcarbamoyl transferase component Bud32
MAELFLAEVAGAHGFAKTVVIKRILPHLAANEQFTKMFISEAKITAQLAHPKIAQTFELGNEGKQLFIVMEYIDGLDVLALLRECAHRRVRVPEEITVYIMKEVLDALDFAHKLHSKDGEHLSIVHRDVSPSNVLLSKRGDVKLIDFGIAHAAQGDAKTKAGTLKGKYGYMSPEQVLAQTVTPKSDIFAAGVVMAEMLMGRRLFAAANELDVLLMVRDVDLGRLERFGDHIQMDLSNLLRWALRKDPGDRYKDAKAFRDALDEWLFEQRHRIGTTELAEIVNSLYDDALARRQKGLDNAEEAEAAGEPSPMQAPSGTASAPKVGSGTERIPKEGLADAGEAFAGAVEDMELAGAGGSQHGVPSGLGSRAPGSEPSSIIEVTRGDEPVAEKEPAQKPKKKAKADESPTSDDLEMDLAKPEVPLLKKRKKRSAGAKPAASKAKDPDEIVNFELAPADSLNVDLGTDVSMDDDDDEDIDIDEEEGGEELTQSPPQAAEASDSFEIDFASMEDDEDEAGEGQDKASPAKSRRSPPQKTPSYDSISAAVASVSSLAPDPAAIDFDDSRVAGGSKAGRFGGIANAADLEQSAPPKPPSLKSTDETPDTIGSLTDRSALAALYETTASRESGKISLSFGGVRKEIFFKRGVPEFVSSNVASELFGAYVVRMEVISSGELDMALAVMPHFGGKLGDTLVGLGLMKPLEVFRHLTRQVRSKLIEVCTWTEGEYEWYPGVQCPKQAFPLDLDPLEVYGAAALAMPKDGLDAFFALHKNRKFAAARSSVVVPELFQVSGIRKYQESFDGTRTLSEVFKTFDSKSDKLRDQQIVYLLINTQLVAESLDDAL